MLLLLSLSHRPQDGRLRTSLHLASWLFLLGCIALPVVVWCHPPHIPQGWTEAELAAHLDRRLPDLHVVCSEGGIYVSASPRPAAELASLPPGVACVRRSNGEAQGRLIGSFVVIGDPLVIHRIEDALR